MGKNLRKHQGGFTLIEIMVVVIIIGILVAIVAPNVMGRLDQAQVTKAKADIRAIENALKFYRLDNFAYPLEGWRLPGSHATGSLAAAVSVSEPGSEWRNRYLLLRR